MKREAVTSSNIAAIGYDATKQELEVEFTSGGIYRYTGVSQEQHDALIAAPSVGKHFGTEIKNKFPSVKVGTTAEASL